MDDALFDEILAGIESPAVDEAATDAAAPEEENPPSDESVETTEVADAAPVAEAVTPEPQAPAAPTIDWNHPEAQAVLRKAQAMELVQQALAQKQQQDEAARFQTDLTDMADGDPERHQKLTGMIRQIAEPLQRRAQEADHYANSAAKTTTAMLVALKAHLPEDLQQAVFGEYQALMQLEGPQAMERAAFTKRDALNAYDRERQGFLTQIQELERRLTASQSVQGRQASGADAVDGGGGSTPLDLRSRLDQAENMDDIFDAMGLGRGRRSA